MSKHRVARTGRPMLTFFGELIAKDEPRSTEDRAARHEYCVRLFRTEAPGYILAVGYRDGAGGHHWAAHTPERLKVAELFDGYVRDNAPQGAALELFRSAMQTIMLQAPELDELIQWSSVVGNDR